jgi:osmotically-inducible protein OsmY
MRSTKPARSAAMYREFPGVSTSQLKLERNGRDAGPRPIGNRNMPPTPALIAAIALSLYGLSASAQPATASTAHPAQQVAAPSDEAITKAIYSALNADPHHFFRHVTVRVDQGVATLSGFVHSSSSIYRARTIASNVPGVTRVLTSNLTLEPNRPR